MRTPTGISVAAVYLDAHLDTLLDVALDALRVVVLVALPVAAGCAAPPATPKAPVPVVPPPVLPPEASRWRPVPVPPVVTDASKIFPVPGGRLVIDESGARWLFSSDDAPPRTVPFLDTGMVRKRWYDPVRGYVSITQDGNLMGAESPLAPLVLIASVPSNAAAESLRSFRGGLTLRGATGALRLDGPALRPVPSLPGYAAEELLLGQDGVGVGLFLPETIAITKDFGQTWTAVPIPGVRATSLSVDDGHALVLPGGDRDGFARAIDLNDGKMERYYVEKKVSTKASRRRPFALELDDPDSAPAPHYLQDEQPDAAAGGVGKAEPERFSPFRGRLGERGGPVVDGDHVFAFATRPTRGPRLTTLMRKGTLGEGVTPFGGAGIDRCVVQSSALCGELAAVACQGELHVFRGETALPIYPVPKSSRIGFDPAGRLLTVSADPKTRKTQLRTYNLEKAGDFTDQDLPGVEGAFPSFTGGCRAPALWVVSGSSAARWEKDAFGEPTVLPVGTIPLAVNHERSLVASTTEGLQLFPEGTTVAAPVANPGFISFAEDGRRGLLSAPSGQIYQTEDGGRSFVPIETPSAAARQPVLCGATRCQLGEGAFREGFVLGDAKVVPRDEAPLKATKGRKVKAPLVPVVMTCRADPAAFVGVPPVDLSLRLGALLFAGAGTEGGGQRVAIFGDLSGKIVRKSLGLAPSASPTGEEQTFAAGVVGTTRNIWFAAASSTSSFRWEGDDTPQRLALAESSSLASANLFAEDGVAVRLYSSGELLFVGKEKPQRRAYPMRGRRDGDGVLHVDQEGRWLVAENISEREIRLLILPPDGPPLEREILVRGNDAVERGFGFFPGPKPQLVLLERTDAGGSVLRLRPIADDLSLGAPDGPSLASAPPGHLLELPSCPSHPTGALVRIHGAAVRAIQVGTRTFAGHLERILRVTRTSACVERTAISGTEGSLSALVVVAGDGGLGAASEAPVGLRCDPLVTTPFTPPEALSAAAEAPAVPEDAD